MHRDARLDERGGLIAATLLGGASLLVPTFLLSQEKLRAVMESAPGEPVKALLA